MKVGCWLPYRESLTSVSETSPGYLIREVRDKIVSTLRAEHNFEVIEGLDFRNGVIKNGSVFLKDFCYKDLDVFLWFGEISRRGNRFPLEALYAVSQHCRVINNPKAYEMGLDKYRSLELLRRGGITVPEILLFSNKGIEEIRNIFREWKDVAIKPRTGSYGIGMVRVTDEQTLVDVLDYASRNEVHYIERFVPNAMDQWVGVNVINKKIIYGYGKEPSQIKNWKVQDRSSRGGHMILKEPNQEQREIALKVGELTGLDIYGVDIISGDDGKYYVVDVNTFPGLYPELLAKAETDMYQEIANLIKSS